MRFIFYRTKQYRLDSSRNNMQYARSGQWTTTQTQVFKYRYMAKCTAPRNAFAAAIVGKQTLHLYEARSDECLPFNKSPWSTAAKCLLEEWVDF